MTRYMTKMSRAPIYSQLLRLEQIYRCCSEHFRRLSWTILAAVIAVAAWSVNGAFFDVSSCKTKYYAQCDNDAQHSTGNYALRIES